MRCVYIDYETYYDKDYTLKKYSIEAYVRSPQFSAQLLGVAIDDSPVLMIPAEDIPAALAALRLHEPDCFTFAQNAKFDCFITTQHYNVQIANPICTRAMSRWTGLSRLTRESLEAQCKFLNTGVKGEFIQSMLGKRVSDLTPNEYEEYKAYCTQDVIQLRANVKAMMPYMSSESLEFIIMTTRMYTNPVLILDNPLLTEYMDKLNRAHQESQTKLQHLFRFNSQEEFLKALRSKKKFCELLTSIGGEVPYKVSEKKTETARKLLENAMRSQGATEADIQLAIAEEKHVVLEPAIAKKDLAFMALMDSDNPDIAALATARAENNSSIAMSRTKTFLDISQRGKLPVPLEPYLAWTGRYTGGSHVENVKSDGVNLQNLAKRGGDKTLRHAIIAPPNHIIIACDSSQVEARVGAWAAGADNLLEDFASGADPYCRLASNIYPYSYDEIWYWTKGAGKKRNDEPALKKKHDFHRFVGKTGILQLQYGSGKSKLAMFLSQSRANLHITNPDGTEDHSPEAHAIECERVVKIYRSTYAAIPVFWKRCEDVIKALVNGWSGYFGGPKQETFYYDGNHRVFGRTVPAIMLPDGYWLRYPNLRVEVNQETGKTEYCYEQFDKGRAIKTRLYGPKLMNNLIQGMAFAIMRWQAININRQLPVIMNVHDEWASIVHEQYKDWALDLYLKWMRTCPPWAAGIPIDCEASYGRTYGEV